MVVGRVACVPSLMCVCAGIVSRSVLLYLLQKRMFGDLHQQMRYQPTVADFQGAYDLTCSVF